MNWHVNGGYCCMWPKVGRCMDDTHYLVPISMFDNISQRQGGLLKWNIAALRSCWSPLSSFWSFARKNIDISKTSNNFGYVNVTSYKKN